ncbi:MAG: hypothetical protein PHX51_08605 [Clostridia bacterium]|nr:hypothetical protein [Clostridia bacterium]
MLANFYSEEYTNLVYFTVGRFGIDKDSAQDIVQQAFIDSDKDVDWTKTNEEIKNYLMGRIRLTVNHLWYKERATGFDYRKNTVVAEDDVITEVVAVESCIDKFEVKEVCEKVKKSLSGTALEIFNLIVDETLIPFEVFDNVLQNRPKGVRFSLQKDVICGTLGLDKNTYYSNLNEIKKVFAASVV